MTRRLLPVAVLSLSVGLSLAACGHSDSSPAPRTHATIALRFLQAVQRHDDSAAARELDTGAQILFGGPDKALMHRVLDDVRHNAGLEDERHCKKSRELTPDSVVVFCGDGAVVVHMGSLLFDDGVSVGDWPVGDDAYNGPHTDAYTTIDPLATP